EQRKNQRQHHRSDHGALCVRVCALAGLGAARQVIDQAQGNVLARALKRRGHYKGEAGADCNEELYVAIQQMQRLTRLKTTGLLDSATTTALGLANVPDKADWTPENEVVAESWWTHHIAKPLERLFGEDSGG
ncbi:MAG: hypothetical protein EBX51_07680, partial [Acidimicrobiia bacterium]|nr:hypothetical protein [Acidimicrobiia bacterium]